MNEDPRIDPAREEAPGSAESGLLAGSVADPLSASARTPRSKISGRDEVGLDEIRDEEDEDADEEEEEDLDEEDEAGDEDDEDDD